MKQCKLCGSTYDDRVDFCFRDGTPLAQMVEVPAAELTRSADAGVESAPMTEEMDAPVPFAMLQKGRASRAQAELPEVAPPPPSEPRVAALPDPGPEEVDAAQLPSPLAGHAHWLVRPADDDEEATLAGISPLAQGIALPAPPQPSGEEEELEGATPISAAVITTPNFEPARVVLPAVTEMPPAKPIPAPAVTPQNEALRPLPEPLTVMPPAQPAPAAPATAPASAPAPARVEPPVEDELDFPSAAPTAADEPPKKSSKAGIIVLLGFGLAAVAGIALFASGGGDKKPEEPLAAAKPAEPAPEKAAPVEAPPVEAPPVEAPPVEAPPVEAPPVEVATAATATATKPGAAATKPPASAAATKPPASAASAERTSAASEATTADASPWGVPAPSGTRSTLSVISTPAGARVFVDDKQVGQTPLTTDLDFGLYIVRLELDGHRATSQTLRVKDATSSLNFKLDPIPVAGQVNIFVPTSSGGSAEVWLGERKLGNAPAMTRLEEGSYTFRVVLADGTSFTQTREIRFEKPGQPVTVTLSGG